MLHLNLKPFQPLHTPRLLLRPLTEADAAAMLFLRSDAEMMRYVGREKTQTLDEARQFIARTTALLATNEGIMWGLCSVHAPAQLLGNICLWNIQPAHHCAELGYALHRHHWGQGLMSEAVAAVVGYAFEELRLHRVEAHLHPANAASARLLARSGFEREGLLRESFYFAGSFSDTLVYGRVAPAGSPMPVPAV